MTARKATVQEVIGQLAGYDPEQIILFGSVARGDDDDQSDIDLIIIKETDERFFSRLREADSYLSPEISVDLFVYTPSELQAMISSGNPFIDRALKEGKVVYEKAQGHSTEMAGAS